MTVVQADFWVRLLPSCKILTWSMYLLLGIDYLLNAIFFSLGFIFRGTVDILTMHNTGPQLFLCIARFMQHEMCHKAWLFVTSAKNVMLPKSLSGEAKTRKYQGSTVYRHSWENVTTEDNVACTHIKVSISSGPPAKSCENGPQSTILDKGLHMICLKWKLPVNFLTLKGVFGHIWVYFYPKIFGYSEVNK